MYTVFFDNFDGAALTQKEFHVKELAIDYAAGQTYAYVEDNNGSVIWDCESDPQLEFISE